MKNKARFVFLSVIICCFCSDSFADGRFYNTELIPATIPYQRAFLIYYQDSETLILQSKYEFINGTYPKSLGWIVPVPSVPEITSLKPEVANYFFNDLAMTTQPHTIRIHDYVFIILLFASGIFFIIYLLLLAYLIVGYLLVVIIKEPKEDFLTPKSLCLKMLPLFLFSLVYLFYGLPCLNRASNISDVDIIKSEIVGIYDVQVIKSDSENAILAWLNENGFTYDNNDIDVFKNYIEKQWCFVVAKVRPNADWNKIESRGMAAPLVLKFKTDNAIYPLALTSLVEKETQVLLYTLAENKLTCGDKISLKRSRITDIERIVKHLSDPDINDYDTIFKDLPAKMNLCKFKGTFTPEQMKSDIVFKSAADNEPYRETKIVW